jgi:hypothetical protein
MRAARLIELLIVLSVLFGAFFLYVVYGEVPAVLFDALALGWALFVVDAVLIFVRPVASYYLACALALVALASSLTQSVHYAFISEGMLLQGGIFVTGSAVEALLVAAFVYWVLRERRTKARDIPS